MSHPQPRPATLFAEQPAPTLPSVPGLRYVREFLSEDEQQVALTHIDADDAVWLDDLERRVQHFGWRYDYAARGITHDMRIDPLPEWLASIARKLKDEGLFEQLPDQAIVNEYEPGQGIAMHADRDCFGPTVGTVSLGDAWNMDLRPCGTSATANESIRLEQGSVLVLSGEARSPWMHGIAKRKTELTPAGRVPRQRRVSLTFRTVPGFADNDR